MNVLVIGLGSIGKKHVLALKEIEPDSIIYALRSGNNSDSFENIINVTSFEEIKVPLDFVIISNPTYLHSSAILDATRLNCPLFIEKPVLSSLEPAQKISELLAEKKILTYVACNLRFHPALQFIKKYLSAERPVINEINIYCGSYLPDWRPGTDFKAVYSSREEMGGGVHLDLIHELDYCRWIFGKPETTQVIRRKVSSLDINATDTAQFHLFYKDFLANISLNYYRRDPKREMEILTDKHTIVVDIIRSTVYLKDSGNILFEEDFSIGQTYISQLTYFITQLGEKETMNSFTNGVDVLKLALHD